MHRNWFSKLTPKARIGNFRKHPRLWRGLLGCILFVTLLSLNISIFTSSVNVLAQGTTPQKLSGHFSISSGFYDGIPLTLGLNDSSGMFGIDPVYITPRDQQAIGQVTGEAKSGDYSLTLPEAPMGRPFDVNTGTAKKDLSTGPLLVFDVRLQSDIPGRGYMVPNEDSVASSLKISIDSSVQGGVILVWAANDQQIFPSGVGADGKLFTADDPHLTLSAGWSVVDLDKTPFTVNRASEQVINLTTAGIGDVIDYRDLNCAELMPKFLDRVEKYYPFTQDKHINWQALRDKLLPAAQIAKTNADCEAIIRDFGSAIPDGHVDFNLPTYKHLFTANLGQKLVQTSDGKIVVGGIATLGPAEEVGIKPGAVILDWDNKPIQEALTSLPLLFANASTPDALMQIKLLQIVYGDLASTVSITFQNPNESVQTKSLTRALTLAVKSNKDALKLTDNKLPSGIGYLRIENFESMKDFHAFDSAITQFIKDNVAGIIIDVRSNPGGLSQTSDAMADRFFDKGFVVGKVIRKDGAFTYEDLIEPRPEIYHGPVAILVNASTSSAADIFSYIFKSSKRALIVGHTPSAGMAGSPGGGEYFLPGGAFIQVPTFGFGDENGKTIIEGVGVVPDILVPTTVESLLSPQDDVVAAAEQALLAGKRP